MDPLARAQGHHNLGGAHKVAGRLKAAEREFRAALALDPRRADSRWALGAVRLALGDFPQGFALLESRHEVAAFQKRRPDLPYPEWTGGEVAGQRLLLWPEQGLGDQIQSARFAPVLKAMGADVTLLCSPALHRLFQMLGVRVIATSGAVEFPDPDGWVMTESIAGRLGVTPATLPNAPYLTLPGRPSSGPRRVGLVTRGDPRHANDQHRSLAAAEDARLRAIPVQIVGLHPDESGARDFLETAELIADLDLVITVDTAVAHLAGAMGKPCWTLIPAYNTDWRWMSVRTDSPWHPSMRLFRQGRPGAWAEVVSRVEAEVRRWAAQPRS